VNTLRELDTLHAEFGEGCARRKLRCLESLAREELRSPASLARLHELALFLSACPDSPGVLGAARRARRLRRELARHDAEPLRTWMHRLRDAAK